MLFAFLFSIKICLKFFEFSSSNPKIFKVSCFSNFFMLISSLKSIIFNFVSQFDIIWSMLQGEYFSCVFGYSNKGFALLLKNEIIFKGFESLSFIMHQIKLFLKS